MVMDPISLALHCIQEGGDGDNVYGQCLGWMMAAIYMGGRIPQIVLNVSPWYRYSLHN